MPKPSAIILDDDPDFSFGLTAVLERIGLKALSFSTSVEFIKSLQKQGSPDVCFVDIHLSKIDEGYTVLEFLRKRIKMAGPIFIVSSTDNQEAFHRALEQGATDFLIKPLERYVLMNKLSRYFKIDALQFEDTSLLPGLFIGERANLSLDLEIASISEDGITFTGKDFLPKGTTFTVESPELIKITGHPDCQEMTIFSTETNTETGTYTYFALFDEPEDDFLISVRRWILIHKGKNDKPEGKPIKQVTTK